MTPPNCIEPVSGPPKVDHSDNYPDARCEVYIMKYLDSVLEPMITAIDSMTKSFVEMMVEHKAMLHAVHGNNMDNGLIITTNNNTTALREVRNDVSELVATVNKHYELLNSRIDSFETKLRISIFSIIGIIVTVNGGLVVMFINHVLSTPGVQP